MGRCTAGDASWGARRHPQPGSPGRVAAPPPPGRSDLASARGSPRRPWPLPSTLVRVRTGLLQALSGATRAECFFMMSRPPAGAPPRIAYILGPAGARLSGPVPWPRPRRSASGWPLRPCPRGCRPGSCCRGAHCGGPSEHIFPGRAATPHTRPQLLPGGCCKLQRHVQVHSPRPPRGLTCSAPRPGTPSPAAQVLPPGPVLAVASVPRQGWPAAPRPPFSATSSWEGRPQNLASVFHEFKKRGV